MSDVRDEGTPMADDGSEIPPEVLEELLADEPSNEPPPEMPTEEELPEAVPVLEDAQQEPVPDPAAAAEAIRMLQEGTNAELTALVEQQQPLEVANTVIFTKDALNELYEKAIESIAGAPGADPLVEPLAPPEAEDPLETDPGQADPPTDDATSSDAPVDPAADATTEPPTDSAPSTGDAPAAP